MRSQRRDRIRRRPHLADAAPGFVWRLPPAGDGAGDVQVPSDPELLVNLTVWRSVEDLFDFTFRTAHTKVMMRRREWFERPAAATLALWWVPEGEIPTVEGAMTRLAHLRAHGPTPHTFTFKQRYPVPPEVGPPVDMKPEPYCAM
jgi:hypothetical protein